MKVIFGQRVRAELRGILREGEARFGARTASKMFSKIEQALAFRLADHPHLGTKLGNLQVRRYVIAGTPFVAYYTVNKDAGIITIIAVFHGARDQGEFEIR